VRYDVYVCVYIYIYICVCVCVVRCQRVKAVFRHFACKSASEIRCKVQGTKQRVLCLYSVMSDGYLNGSFSLATSPVPAQIRIRKVMKCNSMCINLNAMKMCGTHS
jgi:hypothetical protein